MKRLVLISAILLTAMTLLSPAPAAANVSVNVGFSFFFNELAPYGEWVTVPDYGEVWRPRQVAVGWQPYLNGRWCYTDYGWTWESFDPWGGDPYHYGTWAFASDWGWVWVPGDIWAPAWVTWCDTGSYIGWAPVPPNVSISYAGYSGPAIVASTRSYVFVPTTSFVGADVRTVRVDPERNATLVTGGRRITSFAVTDHVVRTGGPPVSRIQKVMGAPVRKVNLSVAKTSAAPIGKMAGAAKSLPVVMPRSERVPGKSPAVSRAATRSEAAVRGHSRPEAKAEPPVRHKGPPHETKSQAQARREQPLQVAKAQPQVQREQPAHEMKPQTQPPARHEQPPQVAKAQPAARHEQPPQVARAQPPARHEQPPQEMKSPPAAHPPAPQGESKAQPPPKKPDKHEGPDKNGR